jgi:hypothetical protein
MTRPWTVDKAYGRETKVFWYVNLRGLRPTIGVQFGPSVSGYKPLVGNQKMPR